MLPPEYHQLEPQSTPPDRATAAILRAAARALDLPPELLERLPAELLSRLAAERLPALLRERAQIDIRIDALASLQDWARERAYREGTDAP
jgi:hypothetical protein